MYSVTCLWPLTSCVSALSSSGVCEAHPPSPQGAWVRVDLQPGAARRAGRSQRSAAGGARSEAAGHLGHLPELQPQGCQVRVTPGVNISLHLLTKGFSVQEQNKVHKRIKWIIIVCLRFAASSQERLKVHQSAVNYLGLACYTKGSLHSASRNIKISTDRE